MDVHREPDERETQANDLYWDSEASVNDIAERLDLSKGTLYGMIRPLPTGLPCPECATELEYPNRTARGRGYVTCPSCGFEEEEELVREAVGGEPQARPGPSDGVPASRSALLATAFLGTAAGVLMIRWLRGR